MLLLDEHPNVDGYIDGPHLVILKCPYYGEKHSHGSQRGSLKVGDLTYRAPHCIMDSWDKEHLGRRDYRIRIVEPPQGVRLQ